MNIRKWAVVAIIVASMLIPVVASACTTSWVLWRANMTSANSFDPSTYTPITGEPNFMSCVVLANSVTKQYPQYRFVRLPDTVDPRSR